MKKILPCPCGKPAEFEYEENAVLDKETEDIILSGSFMTAVCGSCGKTLKPDFTVRFKNEEKGIDILYVPEKERDDYLRGKSNLIYKKPKRVVIGYQELAEKIRILRENLDDLVIESAKYYILSKIENETNPENEINIYFNNIHDDKLVFEIHGLHDDEVGLLPIDKSFYELNAEKLEENSSTEPFKTFLEPPYISLMKVYRDYQDSKMAADELYKKEE